MSIDFHSKEKPNETVSTPKQDSPSDAGESFAEVALRLGGASEDEARRTGVVDTADDQVEDLFAAQYQTVNSPAHRAVWDTKVSSDQFRCDPDIPSEDVGFVIQKSLDLVRLHRDRGTLLNDQGKITDEVLADLGEAGYWGLLVGPQYGGSGASMRQFSRMITQMSTIDPTVAGLASVHGVYRCGRSGTSLRVTGAKETFLTEACRWYPLVRIRADRTGCRKRPHRAENDGGIGWRCVCCQRRKTVHYERDSRSYDWIGLQY